jgi:hypothetical protein
MEKTEKKQRLIVVNNDVREYLLNRKKEWNLKSINEALEMILEADYELINMEDKEKKIQALVGKKPNPNGEINTTNND